MTRRQAELGHYILALVIAAWVAVEISGCKASHTSDRPYVVKCKDGAEYRILRKDLNVGRNYTRVGETFYTEHCVARPVSEAE